jgi:hypothetical protein
MQDPQDVDGIADYPIRHEIGRPADNQFTSTRYPALAPEQRKLFQPSNGAQHALNLLLRGARIIGCNACFDNRDIEQRRLYPCYLHSGMGNSSARPHDSTQATTCS